MSMRSLRRKMKQFGPLRLNLSWLLLLAFGLMGMMSFSASRVVLRDQQHLSGDSKLNQTLLSYSVHDPWSGQELRKLQLLMQEDVENLDSVRQRWQRDLLVRPKLKALRDPHDKVIGWQQRPRMPMELIHPRYAARWAESARHLVDWLAKKNYEPEVMNELLALVKEPLDRHYSNCSTGGQPRRYRSCAVVGNSGILLNRTYGSLIDKHEMVVRLNNARISGFEKHVGSKTSLSFVNSHIVTGCSRRPGCYCHPYGPGVPIIVYICQALHFVHIKLCSSLTRTPLLVTDPRLDVLCMRMVKYYSLRHFFETTGQSMERWKQLHEGDLFHYSSGMQAVVLAVGICDNVDIFGFGKSSTSKHHYHSSQKKELNLHDYEAEYMLYDDLANRRQIPFFHEIAGFQMPQFRVFS